MTLTEDIWGLKVATEHVLSGILPALLADFLVGCVRRRKPPHHPSLTCPSLLSDPLRVSPDSTLPILGLPSPCPHLALGPLPQDSPVDDVEQEERSHRACYQGSGITMDSQDGEVLRKVVAPVHGIRHYSIGCLAAPSPHFEEGW